MCRGFFVVLRSDFLKISVTEDPAFSVSKGGLCFIFIFHWPNC